MDSACRMEGEKQFVVPISGFQFNSEVQHVAFSVLPFLSTPSRPERFELLSRAEFPKIRESLFLKNEVLRI